MTVVSNDPSWWPTIDSNIFMSYWIVAAGVVVVYDWVLTLGEEIELIWRQRWSLMTVLYLAIRYIGIPYSVIIVLSNMPFVPLSDAGCKIVYSTTYWTTVVVGAMLEVIMIARLYAMYQRSRIILIFLVIIFLAVNIASGVIAAIALEKFVGEEMILSGTYMCNYECSGGDQLLIVMIWMLSTVWEVIALCLSVWVVVKHFRDLRRLGPSTGSTIGDCFRVLIKSHVLYFASFVCISCLELAYTEFATNPYLMGVQILYRACQIFLVMQISVLGPRLILSVREYHAKLVAKSNAETSMISIVFEERVNVSISSAV